MVIFMGLKKIGELIPKLYSYYPEDTLIAIVYRAGYPDETIIKGKLNNILKMIKEKGEKENWLGLIYVGQCLE